MRCGDIAPSEETSCEARHREERARDPRRAASEEEAFAAGRMAFSPKAAQESLDADAVRGCHDWLAHELAWLRTYRKGNFSITSGERA